MTQPTSEHRREIYGRLCLSYGVISDILWREAIDLHQPVGICGTCGQLMRPLLPEKRGQRWHYPARCAGCGREVEGQGPRVPKQESKA